MEELKFVGKSSEIKSNEDFEQKKNSINIEDLNKETNDFVEMMTKKYSPLLDKNYNFFRSNSNGRSHTFFPEGVYDKNSNFTKEDYISEADEDKFSDLVEEYKAIAGPFKILDFTDNVDSKVSLREWLNKLKGLQFKNFN